MSFLPQPCCPHEPVGSCACSSDAEVSRVAASASAVTLLPANSDRRGLILWNDSTSTASLKFGSGASVTDFTWRMGPQSGYELPTPIYVGEISAIWEAAAGAIQITELV